MNCKERLSVHRRWAYTHHVKHVIRQALTVRLLIGTGHWADRVCTRPLAHVIGRALTDLLAVQSAFWPQK